MDNSIDFIKSVEIKHFSKMTGYKINLPFKAVVELECLPRAYMMDTMETKYGEMYSGIAYVS